MINLFYLLQALYGTEQTVLHSRGQCRNQSASNWETWRNPARQLSVNRPGEKGSVVTCAEFQL